MAKRFRRTRRFRRAKREFIWVTNQVTSQITPTLGTAEEVLLVSKTDWARDASASGHLEKGCVLVRSLLWVDVFYPPPGDNLATLGDALTPFMVFVRSKDEDDISSLDVTADGLDEQFLHFEAGVLQSAGSSVATLTWRDRTRAQWSRHWDIRQKRKLTSEDVVTFGALAQNIGSTFAGVAPVESDQLIGYSVCARMLLQLP